MSLKVDNEVDREKWGNLLKSTELASPFQSPEFYDIINSIPGYTAKVFAIERDNKLNSLVVITIQKEPGLRGFFSRRGIIYGGPLLTQNSEEELNELIKIIDLELRGKVIYSEIRNLNNYLEYKYIFLKNGWSYASYINYHIDCRNEKILFQNLANNRKRQIKKAINSGISIEEPQRLEEVRIFYEILTDLYRTKVKKPLFPWEFFMNFYGSSLGKYFLIKFNNKIIGGIMCPILEGRCIYELYICGLDKEYKDQYPSVSATWSSMLYASRNNIPVMDFMGAGERDKDYSVRNFKARFGGELVEFGRFIKINNNLLYKLGKTVIKARQ